MVIVGLTGAIGMGKSFVAARMEEIGVPVFDADVAVHELLEMPRGTAKKKIEEVFPEAIKDGIISREILGGIVFKDETKRKALEAILHPLILKEQRRFITHAQLAKEALVVLDIPLLFETGWDKHCDKVIVVRASKEVQKKRVLSRPGMTEEKMKAIMETQLSSEEKVKRADFIINTGLTKNKVVAQVKSILTKIIDEKLKGEIE